MTKNIFAAFRRWCGGSVHGRAGGRCSRRRSPRVRGSVSVAGPPAHQPRGPGHAQGRLEDPVRPRRAGQPGPHAGQHRVHEPPGNRSPAPRPRTSTRHRTRTGPPPPGPNSPRSAAAPSPPPRSSAASTNGPRPQTGPRTSHPGTAGSTPGARSRTSSPAPPAPRRTQPRCGTGQPASAPDPTSSGTPRRRDHAIWQSSRNDQRT